MLSFIQREGSYRMKFFNQKNTTLYAAIVMFLVIGSFARGQEQGGDWEKRWQKTIQAAKSEGKLVYHSGNSSEPYFQEFEKKFPEIKTTQILTRGGSAAEQRLMAERRAGVYLADVVHLGAGSGSGLANAGALDPLPPSMILPEVLDASKWF